MRGLAIIALLMGFGGMAQGQITSNTMIAQSKKIKSENASKWSGSASLSTSKNQDEYTDYFTSFDVGVSYSLTKYRNLSASWGYSQPMTDDAFIVNQYGLDDLSFSFTQAEALTVPRYGYSLSLNTGVTLPTSKASRKASMNGSWSVGVVNSWKLLYGFSFSTTHSVALTHYTYDTADKAGYVQNNPFMFSNAASLSQRFLKRFHYRVSYSRSNLRSYSGKDIAVQGISGAVGASITNNTSIEAYTSWKDRIITNSAMFDDDNTYSGLVLSISI